MATHKQEHRPVDDLPLDPNEVPPEGIEPDLTPAPGTQRGIADAPAPHEAPAAPVPGSAPSPSQSQSQSQSFGQTQSQGQNSPGFDPDSPDVADPQVDPIGPAKIPDDAPDTPVKKRVDDDQYPPYNTP